MQRATLGVVLLWSVVLSAQSGSISSKEVADHLGETRTVCGQIASAHYAASSRRKPTTLIFASTFPIEDFKIIIWGSDRDKFGTPEDSFNGKQVCATGLIALYRGKLGMTLRDPSMIRIEK